MIIVMRRGVTDQEIAQVAQKITAYGLTPHVSRGVERTIIGAIGDERILREVAFEALAGVDALSRNYLRHLAGLRQVQVDTLTKLFKGGVPMMVEVEFDTPTKEVVVSTFVDGNILQQSGQSGIPTSFLCAHAQVSVIEPGCQFLNHGIHQHAQMIVLWEVPTLREDLTLQVSHLLLAASSRNQQPVEAQRGSRFSGTTSHQPLPPRHLKLVYANIRQAKPAAGTWLAEDCRRKKRFDFGADRFR